MVDGVACPEECYEATHQLFEILVQVLSRLPKLAFILRSGLKEAAQRSCVDLSGIVLIHNIVPERYAYAWCYSA
eukprot:6193887-Pleurochrysis_carterae.AAC.7